jgi:hypothetical protein
VSHPFAAELRALRELPFHARVIKYDPRTAARGYDDGSWTSISDIGRAFNGELLTAETYAAVEQAHVDVLRTMAGESGIEHLRAIEGLELVPLDAALEEVRAALREQSEKYLWLDRDRRFYIAVGSDYHLYCGSHEQCAQGLALAVDLGLHPRLEGPSPYVMDD